MKNQKVFQKCVKENLKIQNVLKNMEMTKSQNLVGKKQTKDVNMFTEKKCPLTI